MLYQTAIGIDGLWRDTREQIARVQEDREPLSVSFSHTTAAILLPKALPVMARNMDGFDFAVQVMNSDAILGQASMKAVHLGVVEKPIVNDSVDRVTLCEDRLVLAGEPDGVWMVREHGSGVRYYTDLYFKIMQGLPPRTMEVSSNAAIAAALSSGFGQSLISEAAVPSGVPARKLGDEFVRLCLGAEIRPDARSARAGGSDYRCVARIVSALSPVRGEPECGIGKIDDMYW